MNGHDEQDSLAASEQEQMLVVAPPGCGKTELLAKRGKFLVNRLGPNQRLLAVTFSNRAQRNLRSRLRDTLGASAVKKHVTVVNFHGLATLILRAHGRTLAVDPGFAMPRKNALPAAIRPYTKGLPVGPAIEKSQVIESALRKAKQQAVDDEGVLQLLASSSAEAHEIELHRQASGVLHFDDLLRHGQRLMQIPAVARLYQHHFGAVLVDEFQDLSPQQLDLVMRTVTTSRTFVGDPLQGIYSWAGARPEYVLSSLTTLCGDPHYLHTSYRSSPAVLATVNAVSAGMGSPSLVAHKPDAWHKGGASAAITFTTGVAEADWIVSTSATLLSAMSEIAIGVIVRSGWRRRLVDEAFAGSDVPYFRWDLAIDDAGIAERIRTVCRSVPKTTSLADLRKYALNSLPKEDVDTHDDLVSAFEQLELELGVDATAKEIAAQLNDPTAEEAIAPGVHLLNAHTPVKANSSTGSSFPASRTSTFRVGKPRVPASWPKRRERSWSFSLVLDTASF